MRKISFIHSHNSQTPQFHVEDNSEQKYLNFMYIHLIQTCQWKNLGLPKSSYSFSLIILKFFLQNNHKNQFLCIFEFKYQNFQKIIWYSFHGPKATISVIQLNSIIFTKFYKHSSQDFNYTYLNLRVLLQHRKSYKKTKWTQTCEFFKIFLWLGGDFSNLTTNARKLGDTSNANYHKLLFWQPSYSCRFFN